MSHCPTGVRISFGESGGGSGAYLLPADHPLWSAPNLILTPQVGGNTSAFRPRAERLMIAQLERFARGEPLANVVVDGGSR